MAAFFPLWASAAEPPLCLVICDRATVAPSVSCCKRDSGDVATKYNGHCSCKATVYCPWSMLINICSKKKINKKSIHRGGCEHPVSSSDKEFSLTSYKVHGNIVLYLFDRQSPRLDAWFTCVCTRCELCVNLCLCYCWAWLSWVEEMWTFWLCLQLCVHTTIVSATSRVPVCAARAFYKCKKKYSLLSFCCMIFCKLSELSCKDLFWMWVTPQYLLGSQLMALKHAIRCNATPVMNNV